MNRTLRALTRPLVFVVAVLLGLGTLPAVASGQDVEATPTIAELAVATPDLSTLVTAVTVASEAGPIDFLGAISDPEADLTVFAPTNAAFDALGPVLGDALADPAGLLTEVLAYHVLGTSQNSGELAAAGTATTLQGSDVTITVNGDKVFINDSEVVLIDLPASNGIVHVIDAVLLPPAPELPTIAELAVATPDLSTLVTAVTVASEAGPIDFLGAISDPEADLTVFAPTNAAFDALGPVLGDALADPAGLLTEVLAYHVLGTSQNSGELAAAGTATTLQGSDVTITVNGDKVFINDSEVVLIDLPASNGIVHVIDAVLLPPAPDPVFDGAVVHLISAESGRYLDGDDRIHGLNVDTSVRPKADDQWVLEQTRSGNWQLKNVRIELYLDADNFFRHYNVDLAPAGRFGTEWEIHQLDNGNYELRSVPFKRLLDYDEGNVDTSRHPGLDTQWIIQLVPA